MRRINGAIITHDSDPTMQTLQKFCGLQNIGIEWFSFIDGELDQGSRRILRSGEPPLEIRNFDFCYGYVSDNMRARGALNSWLQFFESCGVKVLEPIRPVAAFGERSEMIECLAAAGVQVPKTLCFRAGDKSARIDREIQALFHDDLVVLKADGSGGKAVYFASPEKITRLAAVRSNYFGGDELCEPIIVQEYIESKNDAGYSYHYRALIIESVPTVMLRLTAARRELHASNIMSGGHGCLMPDSWLSVEQTEMLVQSCKAAHIVVAGVDFLLANDSMYILEVNHSPDLMTAFELGSSEHFSAICRLARRVVQP